MENKPRCQAVVYKRDTYRYTGRGPGGFQMHYTEDQCSRGATNGDFCHQHPNATRYRWARPYLEAKPDVRRKG